MRLANIVKIDRCLQFRKPLTARLVALFIISFLLQPALFAQSNSAINFKPRMRVIMDNDFSGDPDGLFALAHMMLSPSLDVRGIIGSHLHKNEGFDNSKTQAQNAAAKAREVLKALGVNHVPVMAGSDTAMWNDNTPVKNDAVNFIIKEALRTDTKQPLYVLCGAGLTEIASALLTEPKIADKLILVWIGGQEYGAVPPPPGYTPVEYNLSIDTAATRAVFNRSTVNIWQVPRTSYRQAIMSYAELVTGVKSKGKTGKYLVETLETMINRIMPFVNTGETYILGDSPLVLLTALQSSFEADPSSSEYELRQAPMINADGTYAFNHSGRNIRVYTKLDISLMFRDFLAKLELQKIED